MIAVERRGSVTIVRLDRPDQGNGWSLELSDAYFSALDDADRDPATRVIVVTGTGPMFCVGGDAEVLESIAADAELEIAAHGRPHLTTTTLRKPVIAAINGGVAGVGLVQALACDIRFAARSAKFSTAFSRLGLSAEAGLAWLLPRAVGTSAAFDLLLSSRKLDAREALAMGLVSRIVDDADLLSVTVAYAQEMAERCSPASLHTIKTQLWRALDETVSQAEARADRAAVIMASGADFQEGVRSLMEKRSPRFPPLPAD